MNFHNCHDFSPHLTSMAEYCLTGCKILIFLFRKRYRLSLPSSLQIMRQIMAGKGSEESSVMELIKEAEEMKRSLVRGRWALQGMTSWTEVNSIAVVRCGRKDRMLISSILCFNTYTSLIYKVQDDPKEVRYNVVFEFLKNFSSSR